MTSIPSKFPHIEETAKKLPLLRWTGGKRRLVSQILPLVPSSFNRYCEPFFGGGAFFFALEPRIAVLSDLNSELNFLFHNEEDARAFVRSVLLKNRAFKGGQCRYEGGEHFYWPTNHAGAPLSEGHVTLWPHTEFLERQRQTAIHARLEAACAQARRLFDNPGQRRAMGAERWEDFLNPFSRATLASSSMGADSSQTQGEVKNALR